MGAEANIHFEKHRRFEFEFYLGYNFGGNFYIKNENGKNALYTTLGGAPYGGLSVDVGF